MARNIDDTYDWSGFDSNLLRQDKEDADQLITDEKIAYAGKTHDYDILNNISSVIGGASKLGGQAITGASGGKVPAGGIPILDIAGGILSAIAKDKQQKEDNAELVKEQKDAEELKKARANAPTNQAFGMSLRNSGI